MRRGKHWPIPIKELINGSVLALKNVDRLSTDARIAFDNNRFSVAFALAVLAIEEYGKSLLLLEARKKNRVITEDIWHNEMEKHDKKIDAIIRILKSYGPITEESEKQFKQVHNELKNWLNLKMDALYLDWDGGAGKWYNYDDKKNEIKKRAEKAVKRIEEWIKRYTASLGDLPFATTKEKIAMLRSGQAYCYCDDCGQVMMNEREFVSHIRRKRGHLVKWFKI